MKKELIINAVAVLIALASVGVAVARHGDKAEAVARLASIPSRADIEVEDAAAAAAEQKLSTARRELDDSRARWEKLNAELKDASAKRDKLKEEHQTREQTRKNHLAEIEKLRRENAAAEKRIAEAKAKAEAEAKAAAEKAEKEKADKEKADKEKTDAKKANESGRKPASSSRRSGNRRRR